MKSTIAIALTAVIGLLASPVHAEQVRLVVKKSTPMMERGIAGQSNASKYEVITVDSDDVEATMAEMMASGQYDMVDQDRVIRTPEFQSRKANNVTTRAQEYLRDKPNDPRLIDQWYWKAQTSELMGQANMLEVYRQAKYNMKPRVLVLDSGFYQQSDNEYHADSYDFVTERDNVRSDNFLAREPDQSWCQSAHGTSIANLIGAKSNNGNLMAGIVDVDIIAGRNMICGWGNLTDSVDAIYHYAGDKTIAPDATLERPVDIINMSFGAPGECVSWLQDAINYAAERGIIMVAAAGNGNEDASNQMPANCDNVITVGAVAEQGYRAPFSNFGDKIDISAMGMEVGIVGPYEELWWYEGTSQAAPIVVAAIAAANAEYPSITQAEVDMLLKTSAAPFAPVADAPENDCAANQNCGAGILDGGHFMDDLHEYMGGDLSYITHAMVDMDDCTKNMYIDNFGTELALCDLFNVVFNSEAEFDEYIEYKFYRVPAAKAFDIANAEYIETSENPSMMFDDIDAMTYNYGYTICDNGVCSDGLLRLNTSDAMKPASCQ